jgi:hypothetical protein
MSKEQYQLTEAQKLEAWKRNQMQHEPPRTNCNKPPQDTQFSREFESLKKDVELLKLQVARLTQIIDNLPKK